ncbi:MAG: hypothetical protein ACKON7_05635, partial [Planctomycetaceae bacterium]
MIPRRPTRFAGPAAALARVPVLACMAAVLSCPAAWAQMGGFGFGMRAVGGIAVDAEGIVSNLEPRAVETLAAERRAALEKVSLPTGAGELRSVSLARTIAAITAAREAGREVPADVALLGGLERITHVFVDPEDNDIVLAGPGDAPTIDASGNLVAKASGRPLLHREGRIKALRTNAAARQGGLTGAIDPTPEGRER